MDLPSVRRLSTALLCAALTPATAFLLPTNHPDHLALHRVEHRYLTDRLASSSSSSSPSAKSPLLPRQGLRNGPPSASDVRIPLKITNNCHESIWPGIVTQTGTGPGTGGFELGPRASRDLWVGETWAGRVWGRTNCTVAGDSCACQTGDCFQKLDCEFSGAVPASLAEFHLAGGALEQQTFYDISLVDGYNLPVSIRYLPSKDTTYIPPNLTNPTCIATTGWLWPQAVTGTVYSNDTYPIPWEDQQTNDVISNYCPWELLSQPPDKPGNGVFPYPDDDIQRPGFSPCLSRCAYSGSEKDCCVGKWHDPEKCPPSDYSRAIKAACPDAYSYAFDDQQSTFIIPKGGGFEVLFCPAGRSTDILRVLGPQMFELAANGALSAAGMDNLKNVSYIEEQSALNAAAGRSRGRAEGWLLVVGVATAAIGAVLI